MTKTLIRVVDFETTGLPPTKDDDSPRGVVEVGWTDVYLYGGGSVETSDTSSILTNPGLPIDIEALATHHISQAHVAEAIAPSIVFKELMGSVPDGEQPDYFCAHNANFERAFFAGGDIPWICTYRVGLRLWDDAPSHSNQVLRYWLAVEADEQRASPPHRAGPDSYVTALILMRAIEHGQADLATMARWSNGPALLIKVGFGQHFGKKWIDVPSDYLRWVIEKSDRSTDEKATARHILKTRG